MIEKKSESVYDDVPFTLFKLNSLAEKSLPQPSSKLSIIGMPAPCSDFFRVSPTE